MILTRRHFLTTTAGAALIAVHPFAARAQAGQAHLRIAETTDLHVHVWPYDYYGDKPVDTVGLARTAALIEQVRAEAGNTIVLDNGDFLQGNPMGDFMAYERGLKAGDIHPVIAAMNAVGFDAGTIGNHEFNYGLEFLDKAVAGAGFPIVLANIVREQAAEPTADTTLVPPYVILDRDLTDGAGETHPIRIGVIGFTPPQVMRWDRQHLEGNVTARDIVATAEAWVPRMKAEGADIVIALSHSGIGEAEHTEMMENASVPLAAVPGIDVVLTGHHHREFPGEDYAGIDHVDAVAGTIHGKPAVMPGFWGSHMGLVDLLLERDGDGWRIAGSTSEIRPIAVRQEDRTWVPQVESVDAVLAATEADHEATLEYVRRPVGKTDAPLHSYFAQVADDPSVQIVSIAQKWYVEQLLKGTADEGLPVLSAAAPFKSGGRGGPEYYTDVAAGDVAIRNVADLYLYPNTVRAVKITGAQVKDWLERSAGMFNRVQPGDSDVPLLNPDFPSYNFDVMDGVEYRIDLSQPARFDAEGAVADADANRILDLTYQGAPIDAEAEFVVATNNYRASGGGSFPGADGSTIILEAPDTNRDVIVRYIVEQGTISPSADGNWGFAPVEGATALFETGPAAAAYAEGVPGLTLEEVGVNDEGFLQYRITL
ncbi:bifunctional 2',3'-cyclic-nucleotide 2'-phosphodiesterase/3'-nucleotidase [Jannaschia rubra]|uniref:Trifunctional nucleotide phosphoesterase protein YfkN n=1 Tax=Jannaschia rubra TaxID=282197 RepID=A0A0M6XMA4_9RHOB|nr:bifunctional 2',3'-cyclic-nucleotide 2'-phosphodiesterase/3'-nucleotidase [Jannaschia rubra]CTQ31782.1 Trifunctional nucleotide phosphoesterase protein YfkN precursor [Jannaschia rubra]SFG54070.1 2',3'-cyclic-nucleotide 2'-phosphodiesterase / 3'-nucleotidase [Jannaschia rubra]